MTLYFNDLDCPPHLGAGLSGQKAVNQINSQATIPVPSAFRKWNDRWEVSKWEAYSTCQDVYALFLSLGSILLNCIGAKDLANRWDVLSLQAMTSTIFLLKDDTGIAKALQKQAVCNANQMANELVKTFQYQEAPPEWQMKKHEERVGHVQVGIAHTQGRRLTMEDEHIATMFNISIGQRIFPIQLYGIFDGHGGSMAAKYVQEHLQRQLSEALVDYNPTGLTDEGIWHALKMTFVRLHKNFRHQHLKIARTQGTTATIAMVLDQKLWTANVGDSRTILDNGGTAEQLTEDAKPNDLRYRRGIEQRNGTVTNVDGVPRVNGTLAIARAIGDLYLNGAISPRPKIAVKWLSAIRQDSHVVLCCDGIYDVSTTVDIANAVHLHRQLSPGILALNIIYSAYQARSGDNLSALVVKIG